MDRKIHVFFRISQIVLTVALLASLGPGQAAPAAEAPEGGGLGYIFLALVVGIALGVAFVLWKKRTSVGESGVAYNYEPRYGMSYKDGTYELGGVDADSDLEWLRKAQQRSARVRKKSDAEKKIVAQPTRSVANEPVGGMDTREFQERMRKLKYAQLPINSFTTLARTRSFDPLPYSDEEALLSAIEQANEEYEEDENVRELALRILAAFRTQNSVDALSQIALYDLSSALRSRAIATLTDFDHESVFETILLACADPTREVRAAAARGLFRLNFDRADAWNRIVESGDEYRMSHAARAAIEAGIVLKSFDRLVHDDLKIAYEAFALVSLLVKAGETRELFEVLRSHRDERVRYAILHVLRVHKDLRTLNGLEVLRADPECPLELSSRIGDVVASFEQAYA